MSRHDHRPQAMKSETLVHSPIKVWEALAILGVARDGAPMSEERARRALSNIGMKKHEMDQPYPEESMDELAHLIFHPECLDKTIEEASRWQISRN